MFHVKHHTRVGAPRGNEALFHVKQ
jgi:hypothetical protein